jgi:hypothetical protein
MLRSREVAGVNDTIPLTYRRMTPVEVLDALRDLIHRSYVGDPANAPRIAFDTPLRDYEEMLDEGCDGELFERVMNEYFEVDFTARDWDPILSQLYESFPGADWWNALCGRTRTRQSEPTMKTLCEFIATRAEMVELRPVTVLGTPCLSAGAFLTVRTLLAGSGADVSRLGPSSPLEPYFGRHELQFWRELPKLAPGTLPPLRRESRSEGCALHCGGTYLLACIMASVAANCGNRFGTPLLLAAGITAIIGIAWTISSFCSRPAIRYRFGDLHTFRDLVAALLRRPLHMPTGPNLSGNHA